MIILYLILFKICFIFLIKLIVNSSHKSIKKICYVKQTLKPSNYAFIKSNNLNSIIININKKNFYNFLVFYRNGKKGFYYKNQVFKLKIINNKINVISKQSVVVSIILKAKLTSEKYLVNSFGITQNNKRLGFSCHAKVNVKNNFAKVIKTTKTKLFNVTFFNSLCAMQKPNLSLIKANNCIINIKQFNVDLLNNVVKIPNKKFDFNFLKTKILSVKSNASYKLINKKYYVYSFNNCTLISLFPIDKNYNFSSSIKQFFSVRIFVNKKINNLINNVLPQKIIVEYKKHFNFEPFYLWLENNRNNKNSYVFKYFNLLNNYGITKFENNRLYLTEPKFSNRSVLIMANNNQIIIRNNQGKYSAFYNGIEYNNINYLHLINNKTFEKNGVVW